MSQSTQTIVIIGGGIIGCTTAYYISTHPAFSRDDQRVIIIEGSNGGIAQGASGKAGGLVAKWAYPKALVGISFPEHVKLAEKHDGASRWGWRYVECGTWEGRAEPVKSSHEASEDRLHAKKSLEKTVGLGSDWKTKAKHRRDGGLPEDLDWVEDHLSESYSPMAPSRHTAQVHPYLFTTSMLELAKEQGAELIQGKATSVNYEGNGAEKSVASVTYTDSSGNMSTIAASHVVIAAGAWSPRIIPSLPIAATRAHSITIRPQSSVTISPYVLFTEIGLPTPSAKGARTASPEIYARPDNEVYCCGPGDSSALPDTVDEVEVDMAACESIWEHVAGISVQLREGEVEKRQACFLPTVVSGDGPIIGEASHIAKGLIIATGHTCWGICNAPGTAKAISELIMDGKIKCGNLKKLDPKRFS